MQRATPSVPDVPAEIGLRGDEFEDLVKPALEVVRSGGCTVEIDPPAAEPAALNL